MRCAGSPDGREHQLRFWLGTHRPSWLERTDVPLFVSRRTLPTRRLPLSRGPWALDSGGFSELRLFGRWETSADDYLAVVERAASEIGNLEWAAPRDWMAEPFMVERTGLSVREHQERTVADFLDLRARAPDLPIVPVLQGWTLGEYLTCADLYGQAGVRLSDEPLVGIGSVCRRQQLDGGREVVQEFARRGLRLHAFGMKITGLREIAYLLASSDSLAWSYDARKTGYRTGRPMLPGCRHKACSSCLPWALAWRERVLRTITVQQPHLVFA